MNDFFELFDEIETQNGINVVNGQDSCAHTSRIIEKGIDICTDCGEMFEGLSNNLLNFKLVSDQGRLQSRKSDDKTIFKDVENMGFSDKIVTCANRIYLSVTSGRIRRGTSRKSIVFACVFYSFKLFNITQNYDKLIKIFRINKKAGSKGIRYVNLYSTKTPEIKTTYITPVNLIESIMNELGSSELQKKEVLDMYKKIQNRSSQLNRSRPQSIASSLVYYWISKNKINIGIKDFVKKMSISEITINKIMKEIVRILSLNE